MDVRGWSGLVALAALVAPLGCSEPASSEPAIVDEIVIPVQPRSELPILGTATLLGSGEQAQVSMQAELVLAVGEGYPDALTAFVPEWSLVADCGYVLGQTVLHDATGSTDAIAARIEEGGLALSVHDAGQTVLSIAGEVVANGLGGCPVADGQRVPLTLALSVRVVRPAGTRFERAEACGDAPKLAPSSVPEIAMVLLDEHGQPFEAANALPEGQAAVRLRGAFEAARSDYVPPTLGSWTTTVVGEVELVPAVGDPLLVEVVDASAITRADIEFQLAGSLADPTVLQDDTTYGADGWLDGTNRLAPMVRRIEADGVPLCSAPSEEWFALESLTPQVCEVLDNDFAKLSPLLLGHRTGTVARLVQDGTCSLVLHARDLPANVGRTWTLDAEFLRVDELYE